MERDRDRDYDDDVTIRTTSTSRRRPALQDLWPGILRSGFLFALVWWVLAEGESASWWVGVPVVVVVATASAVLTFPTNMVWFELFRFVPYFLFHSLLGGADVAWRAFHPDMPVDPQEVEYTIRLPAGLPLVFMANTVSLLPGTLSVELNSHF
ncbi:Na+/H+ antiporter subunit E, partial [Eudoraea sp.]|uniref:Na+/H+ antiporter subunit E n=1 Tax=Eudoraea sp. TaxID=1979955 RepID=UPI003C75E64C